jgi:aspartate/methionine/tyrosine aminotransferase
LVLTPNPFYQVYAVAAISVGATPVFVPATAQTGFLPDYTSLPPEVLNRVAIAYICSPSNPQGAIAGEDYWRTLIALAEQYDFRIFADECYSEIYRRDAPVGAIQIARDMGADPERVVIFHSLSKRSNLPGLRSGFAVSGSECITRMKKLRAYAGAPLPTTLQHVATRAWSDETHVIENRSLYRAKFDVADEVLGSIPGYMSPEAGFFLWLPVVDGERAALKVWTETGIRILPGAYLSRDVDGDNPGQGYVRVALVAPKEDVEAALIRLRDCLYT